MAGPSGKYPRQPSRLTAVAFPGEPGGQRRLVPWGPGSSTEGDSEAAPGAQGRRERALGGAPPARVDARDSGGEARSRRGGPSRGRTAALRGGREPRRWGLPRGRGALSVGSRGGRVCTRGRLPWGPFPPRQGALPAPCHCLRGPSAATRGGGAPVPNPDCLVPVGAPSARHCAPSAEGCLRAQNQPRSSLPAPRSSYGDPSQQPANAPRTLASSLARKTRENAPIPAQLPSPARLVPAFPVSLPPPHLRHPVISCRRPSAKAPHTHPQPDPQRLGPPPRRDPHLPPGQAAESRAAGGAAGELTRSPEPCPGRLPALARSFRPRAAAAGAATEASSARPPASAPPLGSSPEAGPELAGRGWARSGLDLDGTRAAGKGLLSPSTTTFEQLEIEGR
ncbi:proline-rich protein 2-like [Odocoileus virginianus]|uniref:Proline-rich protein 2-like n=1 Tax=Odocoileus virginianus TaxID=9874 RepID=A0ABM4IJD7_ODOVR